MKMNKKNARLPYDALTNFLTILQSGYALEDGYCLDLRLRFQSTDQLLFRGVRALRPSISDLISRRLQHSKRNETGIVCLGISLDCVVLRKSLIV